MRILKNRSILGLALLFLVQLFLTYGCAREVRKPFSSLDNPQHHVFSGLKLLDGKRFDEALWEFQLALELDPKYSPAYQGMGLALGYKGDFEAAFQAMSKAKKYAKSGKEKGLAYVGYMRLHTLQKGKDWLEDVKDNFHNALHALKDLPDAHYYMGIAFKEAHLFDEAASEFKRVLAINTTLINEADEQLKLVQKVERAMPGTEVGKKLALEEQITRADVAAILIHELRLDRIYERERKLKRGRKVIPEDIKDHPLRTDIETIISIGIRGLKVFPDGTFAPDALLTRASYAMIIEDIISTICHDRKLSVRHVGSPSPFPDVPNEVPYFNAIVVCTSRGIMAATDIRSGTFDPAGFVQGADALLIIRKLKEELRIF